MAAFRSPEAEEEKAQEEMKHRMEEAARDSAASAEARGRLNMAVPFSMGANKSLVPCCQERKRKRDDELRGASRILEGS